MYTAQLVYGSHDVRNLQSSFAIVYQANYYLYNALHNPTVSYIIHIYYVYCSAQMLLLIMILHDMNIIVFISACIYLYTYK